MGDDNIVINLANTHYEVIKKVVTQDMQWEFYQDAYDDNFDIWWSDMPFSEEKFAEFHHWQKVNHFPGSHQIWRKNLLAKNLNAMAKLFPKQYDFFPRTWNLPQEINDFRTQFEGKPKTFIIKPEAASQGNGIYLTRQYEKISYGCRWVAQEYLSRPLLLDGLKFDLRIYVMMTNWNPLKLFIYEEGLARFCTQPYQSPSLNNLENKFAHLTNYAINKDNPTFIKNTEIQDTGGHKRSLSAVMKQLEKIGVDTEEVWGDIQDIVIKTCIVAQPFIIDAYQQVQKLDPNNSMWFEIFGFDVLIDSKMKPWLLEVNQAPSFATDSPLDAEIKSGLLRDSFSLLGFVRNRDSQIPQEEIVSERLAAENDSEGLYTDIIPTEDRKHYAKFTEASKQWFKKANKEAQFDRQVVKRVKLNKVQSDIKFQAHPRNLPQLIPQNISQKAIKIRKSQHRKPTPIIKQNTSVPRFENLRTEYVRNHGQRRKYGSYLAPKMLNISLFSQPKSMWAKPSHEIFERLNKQRHQRSLNLNNLE